MKRNSELAQVSFTGYTLEGAWVISTDYQVDDAVTNGGETYVCIQNHTASATDEPGVGANWEDYWILLTYVETDIFSYYPHGSGILHMPSAWLKPIGLPYSYSFALPCDLKESVSQIG